MTFQQILEAFASERLYQVRRWGIRQPDGTFQEVARSLSDWLVYIDHWLRRTQDTLSGAAGIDQALDSLRKVAALAWAFMEQEGYDLNGVTAALNVRQESIPLSEQPLSAAVLTIRITVDEAIRAVVQWERQGEAKALIIDILYRAVGVFFQYGIAPRNLEEPFLNVRDGQPG